MNRLEEIFIDLCTPVGPMRQDDEVAARVSRLASVELSRLPAGNHAVDIGDHGGTMFCAHLDTVSRKVIRPKILYYEEGNDRHLCTNGLSILGADDRAGCAILVGMILAKVPGRYVFFHGEEAGRIGSSAYARTADLDDINRCVQFDRYGTTSIITHQCSERTCSDTFADALGRQFNRGTSLSLRRDQEGLWTDSYSLRGTVAECTNISVGYKGHHSTNETQNVAFLYRLLMQSCAVDWSSLPVEREPKKEQHYSDSWRTTYTRSWETNRYTSRRWETSLNRTYDDRWRFDADRDRFTLKDDEWTEEDEADYLVIREMLKQHPRLFLNVLRSGYPWNAIRQGLKDANLP